MSPCLLFLLGLFFSGGKGSAPKLEPGHVNKDYDSVEEVKGHITQTTTEKPGDGEHLVLEAIVDVAYYLRRFKFSGRDPRFPKTKNLYVEFPTPPLTNIHWEVKKNCEPSFLKCVKYLQEQVNQAALTRNSDSLTITKRNGWSFITDSNLIKLADEDCLRLLVRDETLSLPFSTPLERFRWLTSAAYYMCLYTMRGASWLRAFVEDCDNFASCVDWELGPNNGDVRANNLQPYACAAYSFCPDPCHPVKMLPNISACMDVNPCAFQSPSNKTCTFSRNENTNLESMILNHWNISCNCEGVGKRWESKSGMCVDVDECTELESACNYPSETCKNLPGTYKCECSMLGYHREHHSMTCQPDPVLHRVLYPSPSTPAPCNPVPHKAAGLANKFNITKIGISLKKITEPRGNKTS